MMGKRERRGGGLRGLNPFRQRDVSRVMRSAEAAGMAVTAVEVVTKDGVTIRVLGGKGGEPTQASDLDHWMAKRANQT
jgi:hypothetical protein